MKEMKAKNFVFLLLCAAAGVPAFADETINIGTPSASGGTGWSFAGNVVTITANGNYTVTGTTTANRIVIDKNVTATITLQNATIHSADASPFALSSDTIAGGKGSQVTLILSGSNELVTTAEWPESPAALTVENNAQITIEGNGSLTASGGEFAAGIGGGFGSDGGKITIEGGTITATGGYQAAGIGGGQECAGGGVIRITGGTIIATGGYQAAGIGGGALGKSGIITVTGGTITATCGYAGAGIGGGAYGNGGNITVTGGTITATGGATGAGIGGGWEGDGGNISISNGIIVAVTPGGTGDPAGIGGGGGADAGTVTVTGGTVYASGGTGPGIGGGTGATGGVINITGSTVIADKIGIGHGGTTATNISGANTLVLSQSINTTTFGGATVLTGSNVEVSANITAGDTVVDVTLNAALTIPGGSTLIVPAGIVFDVNHQVLTNHGTISNYGSIINAENWTGNPKEGTIQQGWIENISAQPYTGDSIKPVVVVKDGSQTLTLNTDYTVGYTNNVNAGTATVTVTGMGSYTGTADKTFTINPQPIAAGWIEDIPAQAHTGDFVMPSVTVGDSSRTLTPGVDYTVSYTNNVNAGTATATVTGMGNYTGSVSKNFIIIRAVAAGWLEDIPNQTYTGDSITPALVVSDGNRTLTPGVDYTVACTNNVNVGTATVMITGIGFYTGSTGKNFTISPKPVANEWIEDIPNEVYTGDSIKPAVTVTDGSKTLTPGVDYTVAYNHNVDVGTVTVTITGTGSYTGSASKSFSIVTESRRITSDWLDPVPAQTYTGEAIRPAVRVKDGEMTLAAGTDYAVGYDNNINAGTATVTVTGTGNYAGTAYKYFTISPKAIGDDWLDSIPARTYTGDGIMPAVIVKDSDRTLTPDTDYIVAAYSNNVDVGTATVTVDGTGNYTGSASINFTITPKPVADDWIEDIPNGAYTGDFITPAVVVRDSGRILTEGTDYSVNYADNVSPGTATAIVTGTGNYTGSASKGFSIVAESHQITGDWLDPIPARTYTGDAIRPAVTVRDDDAVLTPGRDYTVGYDNNINAGTATVTVTGTGDYAGTAYQYFTISPKPVADDWLENIPNQTYTGNSLMPVVVVRDGDRTLTPDTDYTVGYSNNINPGTGTATVTGNGNYTGTASQTFVIMDTVPKVVAGEDPIVLQPDSSLTGGFSLSLSIPVDSKPQDGSTVTVTFPVAGFTLDTANTKIADNLSALFELLFTRLSSTEWKLTIVNKAQPAGLVTQNIVDVKYIIDKEVPKNDYAITAGVVMELVDNAGAVVAEIRQEALVQAEIPRTAVTGVSFYNSGYILEKGKTLQLFAAIEPAEADNRNVNWATANGNVATVANSGQVRALSAGEATIAVTTEDGGYRDTCHIRVLDDFSAKDSTVYEVDTVYGVDTLYTTITDTLYRVDTLINIIDSIKYNIITEDSVKYNITVRDSVIYNIIEIDSVVYDIIHKDSIDYTLVPDTVYVATDITGAEHFVTENARVVRVGTVLRLEGLQPGKTFSIYTIKGEKYYSGTAQSDVFRLDNIPQGVYILYHDGQYSKFSY
ncbi:MAG: Ig-like domain-containing protein [Bacteroidales bacterium]